MLHENMQETYSLHNSGDLFYVIALVLHQLPGKVDPRRWHYQRNRDNAADIDCIRDDTWHIPNHSGISPTGTVQ